MNQTQNKKESKTNGTEQTVHPLTLFKHILMLIMSILVPHAILIITWVVIISVNSALLYAQMNNQKNNTENTLINNLSKITNSKILTYPLMIFTFYTILNMIYQLQNTVK